MVEWWPYLVAIPAAACAVNGILPFVHEVSGKKYPTPFSGGAGTLDGAMRNVLWGAGNLIAGGVLFSLIWADMGEPLLLWESVALGVGFAALLGNLVAHPRKRAS